MMSESDQQNRGSSSVSAAVPTLIKQVKDNTFSILSNNFSQFFSSCDDLFFDLASKAGSNNEQNLYFDSMREVRIKKSKVWTQFKDRFESNFRQLTTGRLGAVADAGSNRPSDDNISLDAIQLVGKDDMEQDVAITGIVNRARIDNQELLYQLNCRFDYLMPDVRVSESNNPLDPAQICDAVNEGLKALELDVKCKVILLKHLDRTVICELKNIYSLANELMVSAGILPQIRFDVKKKPNYSSAQNQMTASELDQMATPFDVLPDQPASGIPASGYQGGAIPQALARQPVSGAGMTFGSVLQMLDNARASGVNDPSLVSHPVTPKSPPIAQQNLLEALTHMQVSSDYLQSPQEYNIRAAVEKILEENKRSGKGNALNESDEDIINLVAMFFDFILDDRNLPVAFQALISRLQIPILKVALKDKTFFTHSDHPARRLINEIASSAVGWDESSESTQDKLYKEVNRVVHHIIEHFSGDVNIFKEALKSFHDAVKLDNNKAQVLEKRTQEAARGKAKAEHAREQSNEVLLTRLKDARLPENIMAFLVKEWQKVLLYIHLKQGTESTEWLEAKQVIDQVVWAIRPHHDERALNRLDRIKEDVLRKIAHGLEAVSISRERILNTLSILEQNFSLVQSQKLENNQLIGLKPEHLAALGQTDTGDSKEWDQLTAVERQKLKLQAAAKEYVNKATKLKPGTWVNYSPPNAGKSFRCKLAMVTDPGDAYVFVNRFGLRVFERHLNDLAIDLQKGYVKQLESGVLFDRAMGNITDRLKSLAS